MKTFDLHLQTLVALVNYAAEVCVLELNQTVGEKQREASAALFQFYPWV